MHTNVQTKEEVIDDSSYENQFKKNGNNDGFMDCTSNPGSSACTSSLSRNCSVRPDDNLAAASKPRKTSLVQRNLELHLSDYQRTKIEAILNCVKELSDTEKLLLYLKLPTRENDTQSTLTNTKQEQTMAFQWIRNHLEECDSSVNLPKHEVYDEYRAYCEKESLTKFLSAPDFGKIVKCIFPNVKARRLGTRGNSKYCYNGLQRKISNKSSSTDPYYCDPQETADFVEGNNLKEADDEKNCKQTLAAACVLVCEWANKLLGRVFETLIGLAKFLVNGSYVSTKSMAAFIVMSSTDDCIKKAEEDFSLEALINSPAIPVRKKSIKVEAALPSGSSNLPTSSQVNNSVGSNKTVKEVISAIGSQVVPDMQVSEVGDNTQCNKLELEQFTVDVSAPVYLDNTSDDSLSGSLNNGNIIMENVNLLITDKKESKFCSGNADDSKQNTNASTLSTEISLCGTSRSEPIVNCHTNMKSFVKRKKKDDNSPLNSPHAKTPKSSRQPKLSKKDMRKQYFPSHFSSQEGILPLHAMQMQRNGKSVCPTTSLNVPGSISRNVINSPDQLSTSEKEVQGFFSRNETNFDFVSTVQRCHSVPLSKSEFIEPDQPLTPLLVPHTGLNVKPAYKAKRNLFNLFDDSLTPVMSTVRNDFLSCNDRSLQNVPNLMATINSKSNAERLVPTEPLKQVIGFSSMDMMHVNIAQNSSHEDDFSGIPSNLDHIDGHELVKNFQTSENLWINDWNTMTMPVMNFS